MPDGPSAIVSSALGVDERLGSPRKMIPILADQIHFENGNINPFVGM